MCRKLWVDPNLAPDSTGKGRIDFELARTYVSVDKLVR